ncbi:MAG: GAF domain-containing protein [Deltaproteobacteria bacterium]|nr:MAG: GAF domain-containing protein [Deltaproteobacteria bacterium]
MWKNSEELIKAIQEEQWARGLGVQVNFWNNLIEWVKEKIFPDFLAQTSNQVDEIIEINPDLSEPEIFARVTRYMVDFLGARSASVRIYDPLTEQMLSYGSYPSEEESRETFIPLEGSIAGEVVKSLETYLVPHILKEELYQDKKAAERKKVYSMMAVPFEIPRFSPYERDIVGVIQIYYPEKHRTFTRLEVQVAELMARRLSFVIARKKVLGMYRLNEKKEAIVRNIFLKLGSGEGVKMKEVFNRVIPELADIINVESCALFSITDDLQHVVLEAGYPESIGYHGIGKRFPISSEPAFELILNLGEPVKESPYEVITLSYLLVIDPQKSELVSKNVRQFAAHHNINSILYVPLNVGEEITHFMTFDALDQRQRYTEEEIEIFIFLGRELMKAQRMERLDDILHDFKNPAIATAGFARRLKQLIDQESLKHEDSKIKKYVEILLEETSRLQEMALSIYQVGKEQVLNFTEVLRNRFEINREAIKEQLKQNVTLKEGPFHDPLYVHCYPLHLERILDNLLNNATNAIPLHGGTLSIRTYADGNWACAEISNTGLISEEERLRLLEGEGRGRGLYITHRIVRLLKGKIEVRLGSDTTTVVVRLPIHQNEVSKVS